MKRRFFQKIVGTTIIPILLTLAAGFQGRFTLYVPIVCFVGCAGVVYIIIMQDISEHDALELEKKNLEQIKGFVSFIERYDKRLQHKPLPSAMQKEDDVEQLLLV